MRSIFFDIGHNITWLSCGNNIFLEANLGVLGETPLSSTPTNILLSD